MKKIQISYSDYQPGKHVDDADDFALQTETGGWVTLEDAKDKVGVAFEHVLNTLKPGDKLSITIEVEGGDAQTVENGSEKGEKGP